MRCSLRVLFPLLVPAALHAQAAAPSQAALPGPRSGAPVVMTMRTAAAPRVDGRLDEAAWAAAPVISDFRQRDPVEGEPATAATEVRILYTEEAIYVGARMHDRGRIARRLGRRDMELSASDWLRLSLDPHRDGRSAYRFDVNPVGVRRDAYHTAETYDAPGAEAAALAWDGVWAAATTVDDEGWTAEIRIPFSQLRFGAAQEQSWGIQIERIIHRNQEVAVLAFTSKAERGGIAAFGELAGLREIRPGRRLEVLPYLVSTGEFVEPGSNPYRSGRELGLSAGLDARYRVTSNLTLAATFNPDFGQVEVDPAVINLTAFETLLSEKRPFFVEGASSFEFAGAAMGPGSAAANVFYSRRIGRSPQLGLPSPAADLPTTTRILGAAKLSGKPAAGWSVGLLNALTRAEYGRFRDTEGSDHRSLVEPRTHYLVARLGRELRGGQTAVGGVFTAVNRDLTADQAAAALRSAAYTGGMDFNHEWSNRSWTLNGFLAGSKVFGNPEAMLRTQRSSARYFQRPDASHLELNPDATSLSGYAGHLQLRKRAGRHITGDLALMAVSPGYESNDLGLLFRADRIATYGGVRYSQNQPGRLLRSWAVRAGGILGWNYGGDRIDQSVSLWTNLQHTSYWNLTAWADHSFARPDDRFTRGGPLVQAPASWLGNLSLGSDPRRPLTAQAGVQYRLDAAGGEAKHLELGMRLRPSPQWNLSLLPRLAVTRTPAQYVATIADTHATSTYGARYIFAPLDLIEVSLQTRLNWTFSPDLSLELYAQPLLSHGEFGTPRELAAPRTFEFREYGSQTGSLTQVAGGYEIDPDGAGPASAFRVPDRSFATRSLRGNAVLRWEYRPGSTFFLVWQQRRWNDDLADGFYLRRGADALWSARPDNVFLLKWTYWFNP